MRPPAWPEEPTDAAHEQRVVAGAIEAVIGDPVPPNVLVLVIPDPPRPFDRRPLARRGTAFSWGPRGWGLALTNLAGAREVLKRLFEARCDEITVIAIADAAGLERETSALTRIATALMTRPTPPDATDGRPFVGITYDWGDPIRRFDAAGETLY